MGKDVSEGFLPPPLGSRTFERIFRDPPLLPAEASPLTILTWLDIIEEVLGALRQPSEIQERTYLLVRGVLSGQIPVEVLLHSITGENGMLIGTGGLYPSIWSWLDIVNEAIAELVREGICLESMEQAQAVVRSVLNKQADIQCLLNPVSQPAALPDIYKANGNFGDDEIFQAIEERLAEERPYWSASFDPLAISIFHHAPNGVVQVELYYQGRVAEAEVAKAVNIPVIILRHDNIPPITQASLAIRPVQVPPLHYGT